METLKSKGNWYSDLQVGAEVRGMRVCEASTAATWGLFQTSRKYRL